MASTLVRRQLPAIFLAVALTSACGGQNPYQSAASTETSPASTGDNQFLPERENVTECIGAVERPNCGSESKGGWRLYLTLGVLIAGMSFIGWRVVRGVRANDSAKSSPAEP